MEPQIIDLDRQEEANKSLRLACQVAVEEVLIRHCPKCNFPTFKDRGNNAITCQNGCHWCYACGKGYNSNREVYDHFGKPPTNCPMNEDSRIEDKRRIREAAEKAVRDWKAKNPDFAYLTIDINEFAPQ
ncbi:MAG: hypothetical protein EZS28_015861 [Streblomastix strix]|uniref:Uncharacterized protein n=1 Tax=Streblomastix strix TaxID=222440 RepID=A0A5J4W1D6_9EUKA|nr:MAG: hypothetical protein EZS28_015861 [Streblomastix strix]